MIKKSEEILMCKEIFSQETVEVSKHFIVPVQGTYDYVLQDLIIETTVLYDERPVIVGFQTYEIPSIQEMPGSSIYGFGERRLEEVMQKVVESSENFYWVYAAAIGDKENQEIVIETQLCRAIKSETKKKKYKLLINDRLYDDMSEAERASVDPHVLAMDKISKLVPKYRYRYRDRYMIKQLVSIFDSCRVVPDCLARAWGNDLLKTRESYEIFLRKRFYSISKTEGEEEFGRREAYKQSEIWSSSQKDWPRLLLKWQDGEDNI